jgi:hypothetical protein
MTGKMTSLVLNYRHPIGYIKGGHAGIWLSDKAKKEYEKLDQLVTKIDNRKNI